MPNTMTTPTKSNTTQPSLDNDASLNKIRDLCKQTEELTREIKNVCKDIYPMEFESYNDYFIIHSFKRGISESGRVNLDGLRKKEQMIHYKRARNANQRKLDQNISAPPSRTPSEGSSHETSPLDPEDASASSSSSEKGAETTSISSVDSEPREIVNKVSAEISTNSIIDEDDLSGTTDGPHSIRRSSRLSEKDRQEKLKREHDEWESHETEDSDAQGKRKHRRVGRPRKSSYTSSDGEEEHELSASSSSSSVSAEQDSAAGEETDADGKIIIHDLYESLVPKVKMPQRRSDWILPPRMKFAPEKHLHTRAEYDTVKMNELVGTDRITKVLSRFEGGVAGVRTKREVNPAN